MSTASCTADRNEFSGHRAHGIEPQNTQNMLLNDLRSIVRDMTSGAVTITSRDVANGKGNVWFIRGPKKNPVVMLHYQHPLHDPFSANDGSESVSAYSERELKLSFFNAADKQFVVECESPEVDWLSCRVASLEHQNEPRSQTRDKLESEIPMVDSACTIKSELPVLRPSDTALLKRIEMMTSPNVLRRYDEGKSGNQFDQRCRYCAKVFRNLQVLKFHEERRVCQQVVETCERATTKPESVRSCESKLPQIDRTDFAALSQQQQNLAGIKKKLTPHQCSYCKAMFPSFESVRNHQMIHKIDGYECSDCKFRFTSHSELKLHQKSQVCAAARFTCSYCEVDFKHLSHLESHERVHTGEKFYRCSFCDEKFKYYGDKKLHETTHTKEQRYQVHQCSYCDKKFATASHQKCHEKTHRPVVKRS